jgi:hypothetical protein
MKYIVAVSLIVITSMMYSCSKLTTVTFYEEFNEKVSVPQVVLQGSTDTFATPPVPTNIEAQMKANNTSTSLVQSVKLQTMTLTITTPPGQTFGFVQDIRVFIYTDSLPPVEIANDHNISSSSDTLNLTIDAVELKPYLISNTFGMKFIGANRSAMIPAMTLNAYLKFKFQANLLAAL